MQPSTYVAASGVTALLTQILVYLSHWPLQPLDATTAAAFAGMIVYLVGGLHLSIQWWSAPAATVAPPAAPPGPQA